MTKVYPKLIGRLGNNLFQIAAAIGYAKQYEQYGLQWGVKKGYVEKSFNADQVDKFFPNLPAARDVEFRRYQEHKNNEHCDLHNCGRDECWFNYHPIPFRPEGVELVGFWQSYKYFEGADEEVRAAFRLPVIEGYRDYVSVHVRRGDYVQHANSFPPITREYIEKAAEFLDAKRGGYARFMFFSDDIEWCKETFGKYHGAVYSEGRNEYDDFCLMASCGHNIIANSSFSWWAAWLNTNPDKIVVSPSCKRGNWFGMSAGVRQDVVDLLPPEWHQIEFR